MRSGGINLMRSTMKRLVLFCMLVYCIKCGTLWSKFNDVSRQMLSDINGLIPLKINIFTNSCIADLGCFYNGPPFYSPLERPLSPAPTRRIDKIVFKLFTVPRTEDHYRLRPDPKSISESPFDPELDTKVIIHGFMVSMNPGDIKLQLKDKILSFGEYNVIVVDWTAINKPPFSQAVANTRVVGALLAKLIHSLMNATGVSPESFHLIGHSLGAHIAGYAGERVPSLGRITGLDPGGPYFRYAKPEVRLDETDAIFVDVIHSDGAPFLATGLGTPTPSGHMDFYPNGGMTQPGCGVTSGRNGVIATLINATNQYLTSLCDHFRAVDFFIESVDNSACKFLGVQCDSYKDFESGKCPPEDNLVGEMGFHGTRTQEEELKLPATFYLRTRGKAPYCNQDSIRI